MEVAGPVPSASILFRSNHLSKAREALTMSASSSARVVFAPAPGINLSVTTPAATAAAGGPAGRRCDGEAGTLGPAGTAAVLEAPAVLGAASRGPGAAGTATSLWFRRGRASSGASPSSVRPPSRRSLRRSARRSRFAAAPSAAPSPSSSKSPLPAPAVRRRRWESLFSLSMSGFRSRGFRLEAGNRAMDNNSPFEYRVTLGGFAFNMDNNMVPLSSSSSIAFSSVGASGAAPLPFPFCPLPPRPFAALAPPFPSGAWSSVPAVEATPSF
mmetsp:Transcript_106873/g.228227  ORF Transcript_106873/g.228227 Transcript_106873/m.228227 type:complete len:270 (+) Transcript_106873:465-1274(+)